MQERNVSRPEAKVQIYGQRTWVSPRFTLSV